MDRSYDDGVRDGKLSTLQEQLKNLTVAVEKEIGLLTHDVDVLKKAVWMLYGAIAVTGFVVPLVWKWALG